MSYPCLVGDAGPRREISKKNWGPGSIDQQLEGHGSSHFRARPRNRLTAGLDLLYTNLPPAHPHHAHIRLGGRPPPPLTPSKDGAPMRRPPPLHSCRVHRLCDHPAVSCNFGGSSWRASPSSRCIDPCGTHCSLTACHTDGRTVVRVRDHRHPGPTNRPTCVCHLCGWLPRCDLACVSCLSSLAEHRRGRGPPSFSPRCGRLHPSQPWDSWEALGRYPPAAWRGCIRDAARLLHGFGAVQRERAYIYMRVSLRSNVGAVLEAIQLANRNRSG